MHSNDIKNKFISMRSRGVSLGKIADELHVPKSTLGDWDKQYEPEVNRLRLIEWEEVEADFASSLQDDLKRVMKRVRAAEEELDRRQLKYFTMPELFQLIRENRREYARKRTLLAAPVERASKSSKPATPMLPLPAPNSTSEKPDISGRSAESSDPQPRIINDLQPSAATPSDLPTGRDGAPSPSANPVPAPSPSVNAVSALSPSVNAVAPKSQEIGSENPLEIETPKSEIEHGDFVGSIVINPTECAQGIIIKCLEAEQAHRLARAQSPPDARRNS